MAVLSFSFRGLRGLGRRLQQLAEIDAHDVQIYSGLFCACPRVRVRGLSLGMVKIETSPFTSLPQGQYLFEDFNTDVNGNPIPSNLVSFVWEGKEKDVSA